MVGPKFSHLGSLRLYQLAVAAGDLSAVCHLLRDRGCGLLGHGGYAEKHFAVGQAGSTDKVVLKDIFKFGVSYWYIVALCIVFYSAIFPFETFAIKFFMDAHGTSRQLGGFLVSILTAFTMFGTPAFGLFVDRLGKRALLMMFGS